MKSFQPNQEWNEFFLKKYPCTKYIELWNKYVEQRTFYTTRSMVGNLLMFKGDIENNCLLIRPCLINS